jgi:predicted nucleotidyltransferase
MRSAADMEWQPCFSSVPWPGGDDRPGSDLDLLYDTAPGARLGWEIDDFADELAALFGRPVGLVSRRAITPRLRAKILHDARPLYAA